jgi:hypothetical protein
MKIILSPIASNYTTTVSVSGLTITIDGTPIDLSVIPVGGYAEPDENSPFFCSVTHDDVTVKYVTRDEVVVKYHYESIKAIPDQSANWADYTFEVTEGEVPCPIIWKSTEETEEQNV